MTFILPTANNLHNVDPNGGSNARYLALINSPSSVQNKAAGNLPITSTAGQWMGNSNGAVKGIGYEFQAAQAGWNVSVDTKLMLWHSQFNAPNRIQVDSVANGGARLRLYSGTGTLPTNYKEFYLGGSDTPYAECIKGQVPFSVDLNDTTNNVTVGTFDNTNVTSYAYLTQRLNLAGTSTNWNYMASLYIVDTIKTSASTPTFSGLVSSIQDAVTLIQGTDYTNKLGNWVRKIGSVVFIDMSFRIGDNATATTFNDGGLTVISPVANDAADPRIRITTQAMRTYLYLRNNAADTATFSGTYKWGTRAPFDWSQANAAVVTFSSPTFNGMGTFTLGSSTTGTATWDNVDSVVFADTGVNIDGSTFKNQNGSYALELTAGAMDISNMRFESYALNHAILINTAGTYNFTNVFFDQSGTNDIETTHATGVVTINVLGGGTVPTVTVTGAGTVVINVITTITVDGLSEGAAVKVIANETVGTILTGDIIFEKLANSSGVAEITNFNYESTFNPTGLDVVIRARASGLPAAAIQDNNGVYTDETTAANSGITADMNLLPAVPVVNQDNYLLAHPEMFNKLKLNINTAGTGGFTITWQYWNGAWTNLSGVVDGTNSFSTAGTNEVSWTMPGDWVTTTINTQGPYYYIRAAYTLGTVTVVPIGTKCTLDVTKYLPFVQNRIVTETGLSVSAVWQKDIIATF